MRQEAVNQVKVEMKRLAKRIRDLENNSLPVVEHSPEGDVSDGKLICDGKYSAATRRASMDLTRALAELRRG